jgi:hypothetical protein
MGNILDGRESSPANIFDRQFVQVGHYCVNLPRRSARIAEPRDANKHLASIHRFWAQAGTAPAISVLGTRPVLGLLPVGFLRAGNPPRRGSAISGWVVFSSLYPGEP